MKKDNNLHVYKVKDYTGEETVHLASGKIAAIQAHLIHFGLIYLEKEPEVSEPIFLKDIEDRSIICWEPYCCLAGACTYE